MGNQWVLGSATAPGEVRQSCTRIVEQPGSEHQVLSASEAVASEVADVASGVAVAGTPSEVAVAAQIAAADAVVGIEEERRLAVEPEGTASVAAELVVRTSAGARIVGAQRQSAWEKWQDVGIGLAGSLA
jgi:hypothetical protein